MGRLITGIYNFKDGLRKVKKALYFEAIHLGPIVDSYKKFPYQSYRATPSVNDFQIIDKHSTIVKESPEFVEMLVLYHLMEGPEGQRGIDYLTIRLEYEPLEAAADCLDSHGLEFKAQYFRNHAKYIKDYKETLPGHAKSHLKALDREYLSKF